MDTAVTRFFTTVLSDIKCVRNLSRITTVFCVSAIIQDWDVMMNCRLCLLAFTALQLRYSIVGKWRCFIA
jgi:hypothetical protein